MGEPALLPQQLGRVVLDDLDAAFGHGLRCHPQDREARSAFAGFRADLPLQRDRRQRLEAGLGEMGVQARGL